MKTHYLLQKIRLLFCLAGCSLFSFVNAQVISISNEAELKAISNNLNGNYKLTNDIVLSEVWTPIGKEKPFSGIFDGNNHVIRNLKIIDESGGYSGFFAQTYGAVIQNLGIENARIKAPKAKALGVLIGYSIASYIENSYIIETEIEGNNVGSFIGIAKNRNINFTVINNSYSFALIKSNSYAGGIIGSSEGAYIENVYFAGNIDAATITGGITASSKGENSIINSLILAPTLKGQETGRIIGNKADGQLELENNYSEEDGSLTPYDEFGELQPLPDNLPTNAKNSDLYTNHLYWDTRIWNVEKEAYPSFIWQQK